MHQSVSEKEILKYVLRVIGIILFLQAFSSVRVAKITRDMEFKLLAKLTLFACFFLRRYMLE